MTDREVEQRLRTAVDHAAPDALDQILSACQQPAAGKVIPLPTASRPRRRWRTLAVAAALALMCSGLFGLRSWQSANTVASVISLDVNPSIQLQINQRERVLSAQPLNQDAEIILEGMDLQGVQLRVAVNAIVGSLLQNGYLDRLSSAILISVEDGDPQRAARLEQDLSGEVSGLLESASAGAALLTQVVSYDAELESAAQSGGVSVGKAAMIRQIQSVSAALPFDALAALSVEELHQLSKTNSAALPIGKTAAAEAAMAYAGLTAADGVTWDADPELDRQPPHYEVELETRYGELEYLVDAYSGQVLQGPANVAPQSTSPSGAAAPTAAVSQSEAVSIALANAGVTDPRGLEVEQDWDDGVLVYEVEFRSGGREYSYEIHAQTGAIWKVEWEDEDDAPIATYPAGPGEAAGSSEPAGTATPQTAVITEQQAWSIVLADAGVDASAALDRSLELDEEDGLTVYQVEFSTDAMEYEYLLRASDGAILEVQQDPEDHD